MAPTSEGTLDSLSYNLQLKLDLHNFDNPRYEDGKYVLTSPRSLEACSRLKIKPVELLYKPLAEYQEELLPQDIPLRSIFNIYDEQEQNRQRKLRRCREERRRIIADDYEQEKDVGSVIVSRDPYYRHYGSGDASEGSVQRERTKWVSSIGHDRVTQPELNRRARQLYQDSYKSSVTISKDSGKQRKNRVNKGSRSSSARLKTNSKLSQSSQLSSSSTKKGVRKVVSHPIKNKQNTSIPKSSIPKRDQKILELMEVKGEEEKKFYAERKAATLSWDEERKKELANQNEAENRRRQQLTEERREWEKQRESMAVERSRLEETMREQRERTLDNKLQYSQSLLDQTLRSKSLQIEEKKREELLRKMSQETNRAALTQDEIEMRNLIRLKQEKDLQEAILRKESKLSSEIERKRLENSEKEESYHRRRAFIQSLNGAERENLRSSINYKHSQASAKLQQVLSQRELQLSLNQRERMQKQLHAEQSHKQQEQDMEQWRQSLCTYRQSLADRASDVSNKTNQMKAERASKERREKQELQKVNIKKVAHEVESWRLSTQSQLENKHRRAEEVQLEREATIIQTRAVAHATEVMRDELRHKYAADSFDKKALKAEIFNKIGLGLLGKTNHGKARSNVKIAYM